MIENAQGPDPDTESTPPGAGERFPDTSATPRPRPTRTDATRTSPDTESTGHGPHRTRKGGGRGEAEYSPRRVQARRRAQMAVGLRAGGATLEEIAAHVDEAGQALYTSRQRAHEAIRAHMQRGALLAFAEVAGRAPHVVHSAEEVTALARSARPALAALIRAAGRGQVDALPEQRAALVGALAVVEALIGDTS